MNSGAERYRNIDRQQSDCCCFLLQIQSLQQQDVNSSVPNPGDIIHWEEYFKFQMGKSDLNKIRSDYFLVVFAVLMATATCLAMHDIKDKENNKYGYLYSHITPCLTL
ncbi:hypothetical protein SLA2020_088780 [Shorea laevis]